MDCQKKNKRKVSSDTKSTTARRKDILIETDTRRKSERTTFFKSIKTSNVFTCFSCKRQLMRKSVVKFKPKNFTPCPDLQSLFTDAGNKKEDLFICHTCSRCLKSNKIPCQSYINNLSLDEIPPELVDLSPMEERLLSQRIPFMKIMSLARGGQKAIHGNCVNIPTKLDSICSLLPRIPENMDYVPLKLKRSLKFNHSHFHSYVRPKKVDNALRWLSVHNKHYTNVTTLKNWEKNWKDVEPDLWEACTSVVSDKSVVGVSSTDSFLGAHEIIVPLALSSSTECCVNEEVSLDKRCEVNPPDRPTSLKCPFPEATPIAINDDITNKVCKNNEKLHNVPGDGNFLFHSVYLALIDQGRDVGDAKQLRNKICQYLSVSDSDWIEPFLVIEDRVVDKSAYIAYIEEPEVGSDRSRAFADNIEIQLLSEILKINIAVFSEWQGEYTQFLTSPKENDGLTTVTLLNLNQNHY